MLVNIDKNAFSKKLLGSGIFMSDDPAQRAEAIVQAVTHYNQPEILARVSSGLGTAMKGLDKKMEAVTLEK